MNIFFIFCAAREKAEKTFARKDLFESEATGPFIS